MPSTCDRRHRGTLSAVGIPTTKAPEPNISGGPIDGARYTSMDFAAAERSRLWPNVWQVAGRADQLTKPGDYLTYELAGESVLCIQGEDNTIRAFYNVCQHRGNRLVEASSGNLSSGGPTCAYHGWRYGSEGTLRWVPDEEDFPAGSPCGTRNLIEMPCESWAGFVWFTMDPDPTPLRRWLDPVVEHLDAYRMEDMVRTHWVTIEGCFNWKVVQDNFNESYHLPFVHPQTLPLMDHHYTGCQFDLYPSGHCRMLMPGGGPGPRYEGSAERTMRGLAPEFEFWDFDPEPYRDDPSGLRRALQRVKRERGAAKGYDFSRYSDEQLTDHYHYTVFPNMSFSMKPDGCIWLRATPHRDDPQRCSFDMWYRTLFPEGVEEYYSNSMGQWVSLDHQVEHEQGAVGEISCGPGIDQDVAVWTSQQRGLGSRGYRGGYLADQERRVRFLHDEIDRYLAVRTPS
jgi:phenylpropionate dioxygenase-like ring-hydroxylating dioxygenase large terminal subunit